MKNLKNLKLMGTVGMIAALLLAVWLARPRLAAPREHSPATILKHIQSLGSPVVLVNFWALWCEPCKRELPALASLQAEFKDQGLNIVLVSIDDPEDTDAATQFLEEHGMNFTNFFKGNQPLSFVTQLFPKWTGAVPATVLMDRDGRILEAWEGETSLEEFRERVLSRLSAGGAQGG